jgi:cytochrome c biogenesis protein CcdA
MKKLKAVIIEILYFVLCMFFGSLWLVGGIYSIFSPLYETETYIYNMVISVLAIILGIFLMKFWLKRNKKRKEKNQ